MTYKALVATLQKLDDLIALRDALDKAATIDPNDLYWDYWDGGIGGDEVMAWESESESVDDDGRKAIIRVMLPAYPRACLPQRAERLGG